MSDHSPTLKPPRHADQVLATLGAQIGAVLVVAVVVGALQREPADHASFYTVPLAAGVITFLIVHYVRTILLLPPRDEEIGQPDSAQLTSSITSAVALDLGDQLELALAVENRKLPLLPTSRRIGVADRLL